MEDIYVDTVKKIKALSDPKRLKIVDMLSCGEICACEILTYFNITQPTLSHDMKVLIEAELVASRREGKNIYYSLQDESLNGLLQTLQKIFQRKENCICKHMQGYCAGDDYNGK